MKLSSLLLLSSLLVLNVACDSEEVTPDQKRYFDPLTCLNKSTNNCDVDWIFSFARENYPDNIQIAINDKVIIDDCDSQGYWSKNQTARYNEYTIHEYGSFDCEKTFSLRVYNRKDCLENRVEHSFVSEQKCANKVIGGQKQIWIEKN